MGLETIFKINGSAMEAQMKRLEVHAENIANINATRTPEGGPYRRRQVVMESKPVPGGESGEGTAVGVEVTRVVEDPSPFRLKYDPGHPDAGPGGYVKLPNVNVVSEMVDIQGAARSYEANIAAILAARNMIAATLEIGRK